MSNIQQHAPEPLQHNGRLPLKWCGVMGLALFCLSYWNTLVWIWGRSSSRDSYYSHALLIPIISGYLVWRRRDVFSRIQWSSSLGGLALILSALGLHTLSVLLNVSFVSGFSIWILVFGLCLYLWGWLITRQMIFPLGFLVFMFPLPMAALDFVGMPMKLFATACGAGIIDFLGIPVLREGFQLHFTSGSLLIGNPCSGLRSLIALTALGALFAHFQPGPMWKRVALFMASVPIAIISNIVRVTLLSLTANYYGPEEATGVLHDVYGSLVFVISLFLLFGIGRILDWPRSKHALA
jgi:exosortase